MAAGPTYEPIATNTLGSATTSVTFSSISGSYTDLVLVVSIQGTNVTDSVNIEFNSDTTTKYSYTRLQATSSAGSSRYTTQASLQIGDYAPDSGSTFSAIITQIPNYSNSTTFKNTISRTNMATDWTAAIVGLYQSTSAITSILIRMGATTNIKSGSTFTLYGIKAA